MKKYISFVVLSGILVFLSLSCKKSKHQADYAGVIRGSWELRYSEGGLVGAKTWAPGNGNIVNFTDTTISYYSAGQLVSHGGYTLTVDDGVQAATCNTSLQADQFERLNYTTPGFSSWIKISGDELEIHSGCVAADGGFAKYERVQLTGTAPLQ